MDGHPGQLRPDGRGLLGQPAADRTHVEVTDERLARSRRGCCSPPRRWSPGCRRGAGRAGGSAAPPATAARPDRADRPGPGPGQVRRGHRPVPRHPVRGAAGRARCAGRRRSRRRAGRASARPPLRRPVRAAGQRQRPPGGQRGLPVPQRLHAARPRWHSSRRAPRARHDPRRRADHRRRRPARRVADRRRPTTSSSCRSTTGSARSASWTCPASAPRRVDRERQLRAARPGGRAALGAAQHRRLRRQPGQGHDRRRVGGRLVDVRAADLAAGPRACSAARSCKAAAAPPRPGHRAGREPGVRQGGRLPGPGDRGGVPARAAGEDAARRQHQLPAAVHLRRPGAAGARPRRRWRPAITTGCRC